MPELAEVEFYRKQWSRGLKKKILNVHTNAGIRIFKGTDVDALRKSLEGAKFLSSHTHGKQMLFRFSGGVWLGIHLGMSGELRAQPDSGIGRAHDHLILQMEGYAFSFITEKKPLPGGATCQLNSFPRNLPGSSSGNSWPAIPARPSRPCC